MMTGVNIDRTEIQEGRPERDAERQIPIVDEVSAKVSMFTGETLVDGFARRIGTSWHKTTEGIMEAARHCADADDQLTPAAKSALLARLPFGRSMFSKLAKVGRDPRLGRVLDRLPASVSTIYELTLFDDAKFDAAREDGTIHRGLLRRQLSTSSKPTALASNQGADLPAKPSNRTRSPLAALKNAWTKASKADREYFKAWCEKEPLVTADH